VRYISSHTTKLPASKKKAPRIVMVPVLLLVGIVGAQHLYLNPQI
jgi:hypothetical protein